MFTRLHFLLVSAACAQVASASLTDGLAAYYSFESNLQDQSGNNRNLTVTSGSPEAGWTGGTVTRSGSSSVRTSLLAGNALNLVDADNDALIAPLGSGSSATSGGYHNLGGNFTISAWHNLAPLPSNSSTRYFVFEGEANYDVSWGTGTSNDIYTAYNGQVAGTTATLSRNAWHHVVHVFRTVDNLILCTVYVDGAQAGEFSAPAADMNFSRLVIGGARSGQDRRWDGLLDEVAVWSRTLTAAELSELHERGLAGIGVNTNLASINKAYLYLSSENPTYGTVSGTGLYNVGQVVPITSQSLPGYTVTSWTGSFNGMPSSFDHTVTGSVDATATFAKDTSDSDSDGLSNYDEIVIHGTDPQAVDTDADGLPDGDEIHYTGTDPASSDAGLVSLSDEIFGPANIGALATRDVGIQNGGVDAETTLYAGMAGTTNGISWTPLPLSAQDVAIDASGRLILNIPVPSENISVYQVWGQKP